MPRAGRWSAVGCLAVVTVALLTSNLHFVSCADGDDHDGNVVNVVDCGTVSYTHLTLPTIYSV